jgi:hypothetical protein
MPSRKRINLQRVLESLSTVCTQCQAVIEPYQIQRVDLEQIECPFCDALFKPKPEAAGK